MVFFCSKIAKSKLINHGLQLLLSLFSKSKFIFMKRISIFLIKTSQTNMIEKIYVRAKYLPTGKDRVTSVLEFLINLFSNNYKIVNE